MTRRRPANRVIVGLALGRYQQAEWTMAWIPFVGQYQQYSVLHGHEDPGVVFANAPYVHQAQNQVIARCLLRKGWDYLLMVEDDQRLPDGLLARVGGYEEPIVGVATFGRTPADQRPIACARGGDGKVARLTWEQAEPMLDNPGLHRVDVVGFGCTAIRRDVLEGWPAERMPWLQMHDTPDGHGPSHDVLFCQAAAELGHQVWWDTALCSPHIGTWEATADTYRGAHQFAALQQLVEVAG